jgi:hypothetical protein
MRVNFLQLKIQKLSPIGDNLEHNNETKFVSMGIRKIYIVISTYVSMGIRMVIKDDKDGRYVIINNEKFYLGDSIDETIDDMLNLINFLRQAEKTAIKYEDDELIEVIHKKITYYSTVIKEIYDGDYDGL